jgi:hypothetical protein
MRRIHALTTSCLGVGAFVGMIGALSECSTVEPSHIVSSSGSAPGDDPIDGITQESLTALANAPTLASGALSVVVSPGELVMISVRTVDSAIIVNGVQAVDSSGGSPVLASTSTVTSVSITESSSSEGGTPDSSLLTTEVIIDYSNGLFAKGTNSSTGISLNLAGTEPTLFGIKGTRLADTISLGANGFNMDGDGFVDVTFTSGLGGAGTFVVSMGPGDDTWFAGGDSVTGAAFNNGSPTNPVSGYGPGVVIYGGAGNDTFNQGAAPTPYETMYGGGQSGDTVDYRSRTAGVNVTLGLSGVPNITSGHCAVAGADGGDAGLGDAGAGAGCVTDEFDDVKNDIFVVYGGSGNDFLTASNALGASSGSDAGTEAGVSDAGRTDAGDAGDAGRTDAGDAGRTDGGDAGDAGAPAATVVTFNGMDGNDVLTPFAGPYVMNGGNGDDTFMMGADADPHGTGTLNGGAGTDTVDFGARTTSVKVVMDGVTRSGTLSGSTVTENMLVATDVENLKGGAGNDILTGNASDNVITGGLGADVMTGMGGTDTVDYSDRGSSVTIWAAIDGIAHSGASTHITTHLGTQAAGRTDGTCTITSSDEGDTIATDITNLSGGAGNDCLFGQPVGFACTGTVCQNLLTGGRGTDMLFGNDDDDILEGSGGVSGDGSSDSNYLDCGSGFANIGHDLGVSGYKANCQF